MELKNKYKVFEKAAKLGVLTVLLFLFSNTYSQLNNSLDNSLNSPGLSSSTDNTRNQNSDPLVSGGLDPATDPGGPIDPTDDLSVPIDGGIAILLSLGLVSGLKRRKHK